MIQNKFITNNASFVNATEHIPNLKWDWEATWQCHTSMGAGIASFAYLETQSLSTLIQIVKLARKEKVEIFPLGAGTNLIGSDEETNVLFLKYTNSSFISFPNGIFEFGAGLNFHLALLNVLNRQYGGAAGLSGIPGTIGGVIFMNAGANHQCVSDFLEEITLMPLTGEKAGECHIHRKSDFLWQYRTSGIPSGNMITSAKFKFSAINQNEEKERFFLEKIHRREKNPQGRNAGSIFRNPSQTYTAGYLLESAGLKGASLGSFHVSNRHANWICNTGVGIPKAEDCLSLISFMQRKVYNKFSIQLQPEVLSIKMKTIQDLPQKQLHILLLKGGVSSEREISLLSAKNVAESLKEAGHIVEEYDICKLEITNAMRQADIVYPVLHGGFGEDGRLQELLEKEGIPFVGGSAQSCKIAMDKIAAKKLMNESGIMTPASAVIHSVNEPVPHNLKYPIIVKPNSEGSTYGLSSVQNEDEWKNALKKAFQYDTCVLAEEFILGTEATCPIFLGTPLPVIEIKFPGEIYDFDAKYTHAQGETLYLCPPTGISQDLQKRIQDITLKFAREIGNTIMFRADVIIRKSDNEIFVLEGNSLPGFTASSLFPKAAKVAGYSCPQICSMLAMSAYENNKTYLRNLGE